MARDTKKNAKKRPVERTADLDAKNKKWKLLVDKLPPGQGLLLYDEDVDEANRKFWHWKRQAKKFYCPTRYANDHGTEERVVSHQVANLFGPKSKFRTYVGFEFVPVCTTDPSLPRLTHGNPYVRQVIAAWRRDLARLHFAKLTG
jgi:hypothetical protein